MNKISLEAVQPYSPPAHFNMVALKLQGEEESGITKFWQGLSYFLPNGGAEMQYQEGTFGAEFEKTYFVMSGELTVTDTSNNTFILREGDGLAILPGEGRKLRNNTNKVVTVLVTFSTS